MAKTKISEFSSTAGNNTDIDSINISEGCAPSGINNAIRELMAQLKDFQTGAAGDSFNGPVGTTTAAAGAFTTLSASGAFTYGGVTLNNAVTGTGNMVLSTSPTLVTPALGTPSALVGTNITGTAAGLSIGGNAATATTSTNVSGGTASVTTLTTSGAVTHNGGTANGVAYLNGSKVLTTGSALTFNGTNLQFASGSGLFTNTSDGSDTATLAIGGGGANSSARGSVIEFYGNENASAGVLDITSGNVANSYVRIQGRSSTSYVRFDINASEQMRLTSTGLGIGTSSPSAKLSVQNPNIGDTGISLQRTGSARFDIVTGVAAVTGDALQINDSAANNYLTLRSGNVGIGTSSPAAKLEVSAASNVNFLVGTSGGELVTTSGTNGGTYGVVSNSKASYFKFSTDGGSSTFTEKMRLDSSGNLGLGVTPSAHGSSTVALQFPSYGVVAGGAGYNALSAGYNFYYNAGYKYIANGYATMYQSGGSTGIHSWNIAPSGTAGNAISFTQAMTLTAAGDLYLGATSGARGGAGTRQLIKLGTAQSYVEIQSASTSSTADALIFTDGSTGNYGLVGYNHSADALNFYTAATERARIDSSGNLLIGKTAVSDTTVGMVAEADGGFSVTRNLSSNSFSTLRVYSSAASAYRFYVGMGGTVYATSTSISAISDATLKENVRDLETGLTEVMALRPRRFDWKNGDAQDVAGFVAQEVEQVLPELVTDYQYSEGVTKKSLKMGDILPTLVNAIQQQQAIIQSLKARLDAANL